MAKCAICHKVVESGVVVDKVCLEKMKSVNTLRKKLINEISQFLQDNGYEAASKAIDCKYDL